MTVTEMTVEEYMAFRHINVAHNVDLLFSELSVGVDLSESVLHHP